MSWIEKIKTDFIITTGDGRQYRPAFLNAVKTKVFNVTEFDFPQLSGTLVQRTTPRGRRYDLEMYFQGENHLDDAAAFDASADDPRPWTIAHPFYGSLIVQPTGLNFDNTILNISKITGTVIETLTEDSPRTSIDPADNIATKKESVDEVVASSFATDVPSPQVRDINNLQSTNKALYNEGKKRLKLNLDSERYFNAFTAANTAILNATSDPLQAIRTLQAVVNAPFQFTDTVRNRLDIMLSQFNILRTSVTSVMTPPEKKIYEATAGTLVSAMAACSAAQLGDEDYSSRIDVLAVMDDILEAYNSYAADLDAMQTENGGGPESFIPDAESIMSLSELITFTVANLFQVSLGARQERILVVEDDTNIVLLAHRFYGLQADDSTIDFLAKTNNLGINDMLGIRKGTPIKYYV